MGKFLILSRGNALTPGMSPAEMQRIIQKYRDWTEGVRAPAVCWAARSCAPTKGGWSAGARAGR
jgi:hypothetical protein